MSPNVETTSSSGVAQHGKDYELWAIIVSAVLAASILYIMIAQIAYCMLERRDRRPYKIAFNSLCALAALFTFFRVCTPHLSQGGFCAFLHDFHTLSNTVAYMLIWTTLWLRQYFFYQSPKLKRLFSLWVRACSIGAGVLIAACFLANVIEHFATRHIDSNGCVHDAFQSSTEAWIAIFVSYLVFQIILLSLLIYPLYMHKSNARNVSNNASPSRRVRNMNHIILRTAVTSAFCIVLGLVSLPVRFALKSTAVGTIYFIYDLNLVVQLVAVIASFSSWKQRFFPWKICRCTDNENESFDGRNGTLYRSSTLGSMGTISRVTSV